MNQTCIQDSRKRYHISVLCTKWLEANKEAMSGNHSLKEEMFSNISMEKLQAS
jgi:hypothetical protein